MLSYQNGIGSKYQPSYFDDLHKLLTWYFINTPERNEFISLWEDFFQLNLFTFIENSIKDSANSSI